MRLIFDLETNGLLPKVNTIHTLSIADADSDDRWTFRKHGHVKGVRFDGTPYEFEPRDDVEEGLQMLADADMLIGHNILKYDIPVIHHIYPKWDKRAMLRDTLVLAQLILPDTSKIDVPLIKRGQMPGALLNKHKLEAWGYRLGIMKGDYAELCKKHGRDPWAEWNPDMEEYGDQDVTVTKVLWDNCVVDLPEMGSVEFEHQIAGLAGKIQENGYPFDLAAALTLRQELADIQAAKTAEVKDRYGYWFVPEKKRLVRPIFEDPDIKTRPTPWHRKKADSERRGKEFDGDDYQTNGYLKVRPEFGEDDSRSVWAEVTVPKVSRKPLVKLSDGSQHRTQFEAGLPYCKIKRVEFNPNSRHHIVDRLVQIHNWTPVDFTETGQPEVDDEVLTKLKDTVPEAADFADLFFYQKILGQLETGKNSWLNTYDRDTGRIHGSINTGGTVSGRCSHSSPNLGQVPGVVDTEPVLKDGSFNKVCTGKDGQLRPWCFNADGTIKKKVYLPGRLGDYGLECRSLFYTPKEINGEPWRQIGCDLKNIEARALAAVFSPYDDGELIDVLVNQGIDLHTYNMKATGITNRGMIKRVFFGLIYGAGDLKLGATAEPYWSEARQKRLGGELRDTIMKGIPALKKASDAIKQEAKSGYLIGLDGRRLQVRAEYAALNLRLQSDAALIAKKWCLLVEEYLIDAGGTHGWDGDFAMLAFVHDEIQNAIKAFFAEEGARLMCQAAADAGDYFRFPCPVEAEAKIGQNWAECH